jgi:hypothetical protein
LLGFSLLTLVPLPAGAASLSFGAKLSHSSQPSNAEQGYPCAQNNGFPDNANCTWVSVQAYRNAGHEAAPKTGTIGLVRLVSCVGGSFRLQFARVSGHNARIVRSGPTIKYKADAQATCGGDNGDNYVIQSVKVSVHVDKGDYIAIQARTTGTLYCSGAGGVLLFTPPLVTGGAYKKANDTASCNLLVQLFYSS